MSLTAKEKKILALGLETEFWRVFRKNFMEKRQMEIVQNTVFHDELKNVHIDRGRIMEINRIDKELEKIYKIEQKKAD